MGKKILKITGILEIMLALLFLGIAIVTGRFDELPQSVDGGGLTTLVSILFLLFPVVRLIGGILGLIGRGRKLLIVSGAVMSLLSIPDFRASEVMLVIYLLALAISLVYLLGAVLLKKPEPEQAQAQVAAGEAARGAGAAADQGGAENAEK